MIRIRHAAALCLTALLAAGPALAADEPDELIPGRIVLIRPGKLAKFVAKATTTFALPGPTNAPTAEGATLSIFDTGGAESDTYNLPLSGWKGLGNPPGAKGYKYKGAGSMADPCKVVLVKERVVKAVCKGAGVQLALPFIGDVGIVLAVGTDTKNYCALFGGTQIKNDATLLKKKTAGAPVACPTPGSGSGTTTSTVDVSSTTSTSIGGPCCGGTNNFVSFINGLSVNAGDCGDILNLNGMVIKNIDCGGLYFGGGQNSVPLPAITPDTAQSITRISSCTGQIATLEQATQAQTLSNLNCSEVGCFFGGPLPIPNTSSPPTSTCVINTVAANAMGTLNCSSGEADISLPLSSEIFLVGDGLLFRCVGGTNPGGQCSVPGIDPLCTGAGTCTSDPDIQPCPLCINGTVGVANSGTCVGGTNDGDPCRPLNTAQNPSYPTSHDCDPLLGLSIGSIPIGFALTSGTLTWTGTSAPHPSSGLQTHVFCGYCRDDATDGFQDPFQQCWQNGMSMGAACASGSPPVCQQRDEGAFGPNGGNFRTITTIGAPAGSIVDGLPHAQNLVSVFCIPPTFNPTIDSSADLPGPGAVAFKGTTELCPAASPCP